MRSGKRLAVAVSAGIAALAGTGVSNPHFAQADYVWQGGTGDYYSANWNNGSAGNLIGNNNSSINVEVNSGLVTISSTTASINVFDFRAGDTASSNGAYQQSGSTATVNSWLRMGSGTGATGTYTLTGGLLNTKSNNNIGEQPNTFGLVSVGGTGTWNASGTFVGLGGGTGAKAYINQTGGAINITGAAPVELGYSSGGTGTINVSAGGFNLANAADNALDIGAVSGATGLMNVTGTGVVTTTASELWVGNAGSGVLNVNSGGVVNVGNWIAVGRSGGTGTVNLGPGGTITKTSASGNITFAGTTNVWNQTGGTFNNTLSQTWIGEGTTSTFNMGGGLDNLGIVIIAKNSGTTGTLNLSAGVFSTTQIQMGAGTTGVVNFNGGTLQANTGVVSATFMTGLTSANIQAGGATIDSNGLSMTIAQPLLNGGAGGLTKIGTGTLTLAGANTYIGATNINGGAILTTSATPFGALGDTVNINTGGMLALTADTDYAKYTGASPTLAYTYNFNGGGFQFQNYNSSISFTSPAAGLTLGAAAGTASNLLVPISGPGMVTYAGLGQLNLPTGSNYSGGSTIAAGTVSIPDDTALGSVTPKFTTAGVGFLQYQNGASSNFNFSSGPVNLGVATGGTATLNNAITGSAALDFNGPGTLVLALPSLSTGNVNVSGGTLNFPGALGTGNIFLTGGGVLQYAAGTPAPADLTTGRTFTLGGAGSIDTNGNNVAFAGPIAGPTNNSAGAFTKLGTGTLTDASTITSTQFFIRGGTVLFTTPGSGVTANSYASIGQMAGDSGSVSLNNGAHFTNTGNDFNVGDVGGTTPATTNSGFVTIADTAGAGTTLSTSAFYVGKGTSTTANFAVGVVNQTGGSATMTSLRVGGFGNGTYNLSGGILNVGSSQDSQIASAVGSVGLINVSGGTMTLAGNFQPGASGTGTLIQSGGAISHTGGFFSVGRNTGGVGVYNISGGMFTDTADPTIIGEQGNGTLLVSGTAAVNATKNLVIGNPDGTGSTGLVNQSGGTVTAPLVVFGNGANSSTAVSATYMLNGGTVVTGGFSQPQATANVVGTLMLNGGTIQSSANSTSFFTGVASISVGANGLFFNTNAFSDADTRVLAHDPTVGAPAVDGGITITGGGELTLLAANTYTGLTNVLNGTLAGTGSVLGSLTLAGTGVNFANLAPGNGLGGNIGVFTAGPTTFGANSDLIADLSGTTSDLLAVNGNLTLTGGTDEITFTGTPDGVSSYTLATYTGTETGAFAPTNLPAGYAISYSTPGEVLLTPQSAVPEPVGAGVLVLAGMGLVRRRRTSGPR